MDYSQTTKGLLGQNLMTSREECQKVVAAANQEFGAICSRTGLNGWKPTLYTGTVHGRSDFGYLGGSSILEFEDCLKATQHSTSKGVCFNQKVLVYFPAGMSIGTFKMERDTGLEPATFSLARRRSSQLS